MFRAVKLITLDLPCSHSNAVPQYLEQTIRDVQPIGQYTETTFSARPTGSVLDFYNLDFVLFADAT
jgi:hypothetical protein